MKTNGISIDALATELVRTAHEAHAGKVGAAKDRFHRAQAKVEDVQAKLGRLEGQADGIRKALADHREKGRGFFDYVGLGDYDKKQAQLEGALREKSADLQGESVASEEARFAMENELQTMQQGLDELSSELQNVESVLKSNESLLDRLNLGLVQG